MKVSLLHFLISIYANSKVLRIRRKNSKNAMFSYFCREKTLLFLHGCGMLKIEILPLNEYASIKQEKKGARKS